MGTSKSLSLAEQQSILTGIFKLQAIGPLLGRPDVDTLSGLQTVMLCGGDKTGDKRFYDRMIPIAEREFIAHLENLD